MPVSSSTQIESLAERNDLEITWPNVLRVDIVVKPVLAVDWEKLPNLNIDPATIHVSADLAPALGGAADLSKAVSINLEKLPEEFCLKMEPKSMPTWWLPAPTSHMFTINF